MDSSDNWHGSLQLRFDRVDRATKLVHNKGIAPLRVQKPFYPEGEEVCHSTILHTAGGIVGGDHLATKIHIRPEAHALITTATAGKIYRSNGQEAQQTIQIQIDRDACLEWLPQETIAFAGAVYRQNLQIELAENACWMGWEIVRYGRSASGERFLSGNWRSHTEVWRQGQPLWIDRQWLKGDPAIIASPHGLAGYPVVASFAIIGRHATPDLIDQIRQLWSDRGEHEGEVGVTNLLEGILCRYRGNSTLEVRQWFMAVWHLLRLSYINRPACIPRVWQMLSK
jgi:urease accessory protein